MRNEAILRSRAIQGFVPDGMIDIAKYAGLDRYGNTNCVARLNDVINNIKVGSDLYFPAGNYLLSATSGTELLLLQQMVSLYFAQGAKLLIAATVPGSCDVLRIAIPGEMIDCIIYGLKIDSVSGTPARHGINLDITNSGQYCAHSEFVKMNIRPLGGRSFVLTNPTNVDGFFTSLIAGNYFWDGIDLTRIGDSIVLWKNTFATSADGNSKCAIDCSMVDGAAQLHIIDNNSTMKGGFLRMTSGLQVWIENNQIEQPYVSSMSESAIIALVGSDSTIEKVSIEHNNINAHVNCDYSIHLDDVSDVEIGMNDMSGIADVGEINITSNASNVLLGWRNTENEVRVINAGTNVRKISTAALAPFAWTAYWKLDETSGSRIDQAGANDLTDVNSVASTTGLIGNAALFDHTLSQVLSHVNNSDLNVGSTSFYFKAHVKIPNKARTQWIVSKYASGQTDFYLSYNPTSDKWDFTVFSAIGGNAQILSANAPAINTWYIIQIWYDQGTQEIFMQVNNETVLSASFTEALTGGTAAFNLGAISSLPQYSDTIIDEAGFAKSVPSSEQRLAIYNSGNGITYP